MLTIVALLTDPEVSHTAWRITRPFTRLREAGNSTHFFYNKDWGTADGVVWQPDMFKDYDFVLADVMILPRVKVPIQYRTEFVEWINQLHKDNITVIYETDDDIYSKAWVQHHIDCNPYMSAIEKNAIMNQSIVDRWILKQVDGITTSTEHLANVLKQYTDKPIEVIPNAIDQTLFEKGLIDTPWDQYITIGWSAGYRPAADAKLVAEAWAKIYKEYPNVHFVIAGYRQHCLTEAVFDPSRRHIVSYLPMWSYPVGMKVTIGCCSAAPTEFNKSRGPGKKYEYALAGAFPVCSRTVYGEIADDWYNYIKLLLDNPARLKAGREYARQDVLENHTLTKNLWRWTNAWESLVALSSRTIRV